MAAKEGLQGWPREHLPKQDKRPSGVSHTNIWDPRGPAWAGVEEDFQAEG